MGIFFFFFYILITIITLLRSNPVLSFAVIHPQWSLHLFSFSNSLSQRPTFATVSLIGAALLLIYWAKKEQLSVAYVTFDTNSRSLNNYHNIFGGVGGALTIQSFWLDKDLFCVDAQNVSRCRTINNKKNLCGPMSLHVSDPPPAPPPCLLPSSFFFLFFIIFGRAKWPRRLKIINPCFLRNQSCQFSWMKKWRCHSDCWNTFSSLIP